MIARRKKATGKTAYLVRVGDSPARTFGRYEDAEEYESSLRRSRRRARAGLDVAEKPNVTFSSLLDMWEANFKPSPWKLKMLAPSRERWGKVKVRDLHPEQIGAWIANLTGKGGRTLSGKTKSHMLAALRQVLNAAVEWGYVSRSPARPGAFKTPSRKRMREIRPFETWAEVERVAAACGSNSPLVRFVCATGLRCPGEVIDLQWSQLDQPGRVMTVGSKTAAGHRTVPLSRHALQALADQPRSITGLVFTGKKGGRLDYDDWRENDWRVALAVCKLDHRTPYEMRHTFATLALANGAAIDDVATVMGHEDITMAYTHYRKWIKTAADRLRASLDTIGKEKAA